MDTDTKENISIHTILKRKLLQHVLAGPGWSGKDISLSINGSIQMSCLKKGANSFIRYWLNQIFDYDEIKHILLN